MIRIKLPLKLESAANKREHWAVSRKRNLGQCNAIRHAMEPLAFKIQLPCNVLLTRVGKRQLDDDNLQYAFKSIRDCVADIILPGFRMGRSDADERIEWHYKQEKGQYAIVIQIFWE